MNESQIIVASFSAPGTLVNRAKAYAEADDSTFSRLIRAALREYLANPNRKEAA